MGGVATHRRFAIGTAEYPDRSATLIVEMPELVAEGARLTGPGIETEAHLSLPEIAAFQANRARFPLGFDCFFTCGERVAGLPRSTRVQEG
jgi:alpha-D-ribose 1-methylphosphonate 5-triphosphate synthase subunit PhnH